MKTQAWGWLTAGVLAAGMNASYHDGGLGWVHHIADRVQHNTAAVLALASGNADQFLTEARIVAAHNQTAPCRFANAMARVETRIARSESQWDRVQAMSDRESAQLDRLEASRARIEARVAEQSERLRVSMIGFNPADLNLKIEKFSDCPRMKLKLPKMPLSRIPAPVLVHVALPSAGPV